MTWVLMSRGGEKVLPQSELPLRRMSNDLRRGSLRIISSTSRFVTRSTTAVGPPTVTLCTPSDSCTSATYYVKWWQVVAGVGRRVGA